MKLIVGLGNPGAEYQNTRHNLGFKIIDHLANKLNIELKQKKFNGLYYKSTEYIILKPQTYMNSSGECIKSFLNYFCIPTTDLLVVYDDITLQLGKFRYRQQGSAGGHNGVKNTIELLGSKEFGRLRVGIGYERNCSLSEWVLGKFAKEEKSQISTILPLLVTSLIELISETKFEKIMNKYNSKQK